MMSPDFVKNMYGHMPGRDGLFSFLAYAASVWGRKTSIEDMESRLRSISPEPHAEEDETVYLHEPACDLSVIVPAYNVERYVSSCLESLIGQLSTYDIEFIVINDGSTDGTLSILQDYAQRDTRIRVINQDNRGLSGARNRGIDEARGRYIAFVDSDDELEANHIQTLMDALVSSHKDYVTSGYSRIDENGRLIERVLDNTYGTAWARIYKREIWDGLRFPEGLWYEDTIMAYFIKPRYTEYVIHDTSYLYRVRGGSISHAMHGKKKVVDAYWITKRMISDYRAWNLPWTDEIYKTTLNQLGSLTYWRTRSLPREQRMTIFSCCCALLRVTKEFQHCSAGTGKALKAIERSLRTGNYTLWALAGAYGTMETMIGEQL
ncbi:glycosyltransferase family 2 protein [Bifidobacterium saguinibicoloris]|uniref:glycosyltransferase family 2 protein n=1 Tax=Bifidobacterium saguinibicoloris TaxID=2834433 RepID=UPI001C5972BC|nr:glycosyltransferase family 2 protein [Bifidobacterium saguinibicoloris]MBW3081187.1 glycosyltransferase family 2 protein [Bifidobacterium saguinibicoloris]